MKITIDGKNFEVDINRAKKLGLVQEIPCQYIPNVGDVLTNECKTMFIILLKKCNNTYILSGNLGESCFMYEDEPRTSSEIVNWMQKNHFTWTGFNFNKTIPKCLWGNPCEVVNNAKNP